MGTIIQKLDKTLETKAAIRQAIIGKGQAVEDTDPFESYPEKIGAIQTGVQLPELSNPGTAADLLAGKQLVDQYGNPLTGTMPQRSVANLTASGAAVTVPAGYYPSQVSKSVATATHPKPTISRSGGTVTANHVQSAGYTSGGTTSETLTIPTKAGTTITPGTSRKTAVSSGYLTTGAVYVAGDANLKAENIKSGVSIFGVAGTLQANAFTDTVPVTITNNCGSEVNISYTSTLFLPSGIDSVELASGGSTTIYTFPNAPIFVRALRERYAVMNGGGVGCTFLDYNFPIDSRTGSHFNMYCIMPQYGPCSLNLA